jgi:hypothetical protein
VGNSAPSSDLSEVFIGIKEAITRLNKIGLLIRFSSRSTITARARKFASQYTDLVRLPEFENGAFLALHCLYPNASGTLRQQLLDSMIDRYAKLRYEAFRIDANRASATSSPKIESAVKSDDITPDGQVPDPPKIGDDEVQKTQQKVSIVIPLSSIDTARVPANLEQAVAPSVLQSRAPKTLIGHNGHLREPDLPKFEEGEDYTSCRWCHQVIDRSVLHKTRKEWSDEGRRHYQLDLQPYICLAEDCRDVRPSFASSREWFTHMKSSHSDFWSRKMHNQPAWVCTARHKNDSIYAFSSKAELLNHIRVHKCKTWVCTARHENDLISAFSSRDELLNHIGDHTCNSKEVLHESDPDYAECLSQSMRQASSCPLCLFSMEQQPLNDRNANDDADDEDTVTSWAMGTHIADHLHHLMTVSLQIMSAMQASQDEDEGDTKSQSSRPSTALSGPDEEANKKRLEDLPESVQGSIDWFEVDFQQTLAAQGSHFFAISRVPDDAEAVYGDINAHEILHTEFGHSSIENVTTQHSDGPNPLDTTGLCLLSLDGGGVRGLSSLYILKDLMGRLNIQRQDAGHTYVKPCQVFDLIGGTGTGGYVDDREFVRPS